jgi:hypothetical protein
MTDSPGPAVQLTLGSCPQGRATEDQIHTQSVRISRTVCQMGRGGRVGRVYGFARRGSHFTHRNRPLKLNEMSRSVTVLGGEALQ